MRQIRGKLVLAGDRVSLREVTAAFGGGEVRVSGEVELEGTAIARHDLTITARGVTVEPQPRVELLLDADTKLTSSKGGAPPKLSGLLRVQRLVYGRHVELPEALTSFNREQRRESYDPARDRLAIDLAIEAAAPIIVRNSLVDLELVAAGKEPRLRVVGTDQRFGVLGTLAVKRGRVLFRGDEFQVTRGEVQFENPWRIDPKFDLRALATRRKRPDANIVFLAHGDRDAFEIDVRCDAPATERPPPPFSCDYKNDTLRCDSFDQLVTLWVCRS